MKPVWRRRISSISLQLLLTFFGVLAALAVDNFRESVGERSKEREYLTAFRNALQEDTATVNVELARAFAKLNAASRLLKIIGGHDSISSEDLGETVESILMLIDPTYNTAIYEDLKATGNSRLIRNVALKNDIIGHYLYLTKVISLQQNSTHFISYNQIVVDQFEFEEFQAVETVSPKKIITKLKANAELTQYLARLRKTMLTYRNSLLYSVLPRTLMLLESVDAELKKME